jgi:SAM-dependent methyltransferase
LPRNEAELYGRDYFERNEYGLDAKRAIAYVQESGRILDLIKPRVIDYGCGIGDFLNYFVGWVRYGVEISEYAAGVAQSKGVTIIKADYDASPIYANLVIFRGTLQHIDQPFDALRWAHYQLRPGGLLAILAQPNADSLVYRLFGDLPALDWPRNYWIPGKRELCNVLEHIGFTVQDVIYPYRGGPYAAPARDTWRFIQRLFGRRVKFAFPGNMMEVYAVKHD